MLPFVRIDALWYNGLAGAIPSALCFILAGAFLFAATRRIFQSPAPAVAATALFALNPNILYLQSIPMTEPYFFASIMGLLYFSVRFRDTQGWGSVAGAGLAALAGTLTRYDGWILIPFAAVYFAITAKRYRAAVALLFCALASLGPAFWLAHNWWMTNDALDFYRGPYSARAIQGDQPCPGRNDWPLAGKHYLTAAWLCGGAPLVWIGLAGLAASLAKLTRAFWPLALLALPCAFYVWSIHSGVVPIFVPSLWYGAYYNTRYGTSALPLLALAAAGLVALAPARWRTAVVAGIVLAAVAPWALHPHPGNWITWEESRINSEGRRAWTSQAAEYLAPRYKPGSGIITSFNDMSGIFREAKIPFSEIFTGDNGLPWDATITRPDIFLSQEWAVVMTGDPVQSCINRAGRYGIHYKLEKQIVVAGTKDIIEIYRK
jgi:hypothetical protein